MAMAKFIGPIIPKTIYLTFDADMSQGMEAKVKTGQVKFWYDAGVFDFLIQNQIPASFFVSGLFAESYPDLMKNLSSNKNFSFQNHSYDESSFTPHCYWLRTLTTDQEKIDQINKTQEVIRKFTGQTPTFFRFPGICRSPHDDQLVKNLGFTIDNGDVISADAFNSNTDRIERNIFRKAKSGSVILMHIGGPNAPKDLEVLRAIVPKFQDLGYTFEVKS